MKDFIAVIHKDTDGKMILETGYLSGYPDIDAIAEDFIALRNTDDDVILKFYDGPEEVDKITAEFYREYYPELFKEYKGYFNIGG